MEIHDTLKTLDFVVIAVYIVALLSLGFWISFRRKHSRDLFLAGRSLGWTSIGLSVWGTNITPASMIAVSGAAYTSGMVTSNFALLSWPFLMLMGMIFVPHYLNTKISTMPEFMSRRYDNSCRIFLSWYNVLTTPIIWVAAILYTGGIIASQIFDCSFATGVVALAVIATSFTVAGGLAAVVITDSFQCILMVGASLALVIITFTKVGSFSRLVESVPSHYWDLFQSGENCRYPWYALILGYPVLAIWFYCTDQTIVQRVLGARNIRHAQLSTLFVAYMKVIDPIIFWIPGILCFVLHPNLANSDHAYVTMVTTYLPTGMVGLIVAILIAAVISTVDSGLNSVSAIFTLDIYLKTLKPDASEQQVIRVGRIVTVAAAVVSVIFALLMTLAKKNLFDLMQSLISFVSPPMAAVFLIGVLWKRATGKAAFYTLVMGVMACLAMGICVLAEWPGEDFWPHYLVLAFCNFVALCGFMVLLSLLSAPPPPEKALPSLRETYAGGKHGTRLTWILWAILAVIMAAIYIFFG